jgi:hypothetical protein
MASFFMAPPGEVRRVYPTGASFARHNEQRQVAADASPAPVTQSPQCKSQVHIASLQHGLHRNKEGEPFAVFGFGGDLDVGAR